MMSEEILYEEYGKELAEVTEGDLAGFFEGWLNKPPASVLLSVLAGSYSSFIARTADGRVIGIVSAISDGVLSAHIPLLEVLPEFQGRGVGSRLLSLMLERLDGLYMVDLSCDEDLVPFYRRFGMEVIGAMGIRRPSAIPSN
jgi:ribosomal protein S18 acetylase RimI-like enzyme